MTSLLSDTFYLIAFLFLVAWGFVVFLQELISYTTSLLGFWYWRLLVSLAIALIALLDTRVAFSTLEQYCRRDTPEAVNAKGFNRLFVLALLAVIFGLTTFLPASRDFFGFFSILFLMYSLLFLGVAVWYTNRR